MLRYKQNNYEHTRYHTTTADTPAPQNLRGIKSILTWDSGVAVQQTHMLQK